MKNWFRQLLGTSTTTCNCKDYSDLEFSRESISQRINTTKNIIRTLRLLSKSDDNRLFECKICEQYWQQSLAWNWDGKSYLFKVPHIGVEEWVEQQFVSPADMVIYLGVMERYYSRTEFKETEAKCRIFECNNDSLENGVLCKTHFVENLQTSDMLPKKPNGRTFKTHHAN